MRFVFTEQNTVRYKYTALENSSPVFCIRFLSLQKWVEYNNYVV